MGLREWINGIISKRFGRKKLNAANIDTAITEGEPTFHSTMDELKVSGIDDLSKFSFEEIQQEYISSLSEMAGKYKNAILNDETLKKIREEEMKTGKIGETPFICTFDENGGVKTTVIITEKSCSKVKEENGETTYQETRIDASGMKTVVNTKDSSLVIRGNVTQNEIDKIKRFSEDNKSNIVNVKNFNSQEVNNEYSNLLKKLGVNTEIDLKNTKKYMSSFSGRVIRDINNNLSKLEEMTLVLDRENPKQNPLIISLNTFEKGRGNSERKFYLTKNGTYIDETSFRIEDGNVRFAELSLEDIKKLAKNRDLEPSFIEKSKKINRDNIRLIPKTAEKIHKEAARQKTEPEKDENVITPAETNPEDIVQENRNDDGGQER